MSPERDAAALAAALNPRPKQPVAPVMKLVVAEPWPQAAGYAEVDRRSRGRCECPRPCGFMVEVHHHIAGRGGPDPHHPDNLLGLASDCHMDIHANPERSYDEGTMRKRVR